MINQLEKVRPRINHFDYKQYPFYTYVYLNPFKDVQSKYRLPGQFLEFAYEPFYVGKATGSGFRHNQHIAEYLRTGVESKNHKTVHDPHKRDAFRQLEKNMKQYGQSDVRYPRNWEEYQKDWIIVIKASSNPDALARFEKSVISAIGTLKNGRGPLVNILLG